METVDIYKAPLAIPIKVKSAGFFADKILAEQPATVVNGVTSQGVFLLVENRYVLFISFGSNRAPLTINLGVKQEALTKLKVGSTAQVKKNEVFFPEIRTRLIWNENLIWHPTQPTLTNSRPEQRLYTLKKIARGVVQEKEGEMGFTPLLGVIFKEIGGEIPVELEPLCQALETLQTALREKNNGVTHRILERFLGFGRGLTPSGDDFAAGILLALNRWHELVCPGYPRRELNIELISSAQRKTTRLSANLIEQAATGIADERLLKTIDNIMHGEEDIQENILEISHLGHSSGADTLVGMAVVLTCES
ncbi:MAG: DUF2877 domain-containing protein [Anaerolineae bacterium]|nr:DUF2877 domain-containing protein [Anaerolineae bacterium]